MASGLELPAATTAAATTTAATTTATTFCTRAGDVDREGATVVVLTVQRFDRCIRFSVVGHLDETKALAAAGVAIIDDLGTVDLSKLREQFLKPRIVNRVREISDVEFLAHIFLVVTARVPADPQDSLPLPWEGPEESHFVPAFI